MAVCFFLVALPASGKSTLVKKMLEENPTLKVVSLDKYIEQKMKENNCSYNVVFKNKEMMKECEKAYKEELANILENKENFIWDQMNIGQNSRISKINRLKSHKYEVVCLEFNIPHEVWMERINKRNVENPEKTFSAKFYEDMYTAFESVEKIEKFDSVFLVGVNGELQKKFEKALEKKIK